MPSRRPYFANLAERQQSVDFPLSFEKAIKVDVGDFAASLPVKIAYIIHPTDYP